MVKKIIVLAIAFVLLISVPMYDAIANPTPFSPVTVGAGTGTSTVIKSPEEIQTLISSMPSIKDYSSDKTIMELYPEFKPFSYSEDGYSSETTSRYTTLDGERVLLRNESKREHVLEMFFTADALYYHVVGTMTQTKDTYEAIRDEYTEDDEIQGEYIEGTRTVTTYELYACYAEDRVLLKFDDYTTKSQERKSEGGSWKEVESEDADDEEAQLAEDVAKATKKIFGQWMELITYTDEEIQEMFGDLFGESTEEPTTPEEVEAYQKNYIDAMVNYLVFQTANEFAKTNLDSIESATEGNVAYLTSLASCLSSLDMFDKSGNEYELKTNDGETQKQYLTALGFYVSNYNDTSADVSFNTESDSITINQKLELSKSSSGNYSSTVIRVQSTFSNVNNTVVSLKDAKIKSVVDTFKKPFGDIYRKQLEDSMKQEGEE